LRNCRPGLAREPLSASSCRRPPWSLLITGFRFSARLPRSPGDGLHERAPPGVKQGKCPYVRTGFVRAIGRETDAIAPASLAPDDIRRYARLACRTIESNQKNPWSGNADRSFRAISDRSSVGAISGCCSGRQPLLPAIAMRNRPAYPTRSTQRRAIETVCADPEAGPAHRYRAAIQSLPDHYRPIVFLREPVGN